MAPEFFMNKTPEVKMSVPDSDAMGWINMLREGGFTQVEIDAIMSHLNKTYRDQKFPKEQRIEQELKRTEEYLFNQYGHKLDDERRAYLRKSISERNEFKD